MFNRIMRYLDPTPEIPEWAVRFAAFCSPGVCHHCYHRYYLHFPACVKLRGREHSNWIHTT